MPDLRPVSLIKSYPYRHPWGVSRKADKTVRVCREMLMRRAILIIYIYRVSIATRLWRGIAACLANCAYRWRNDRSDALKK